MILTLVGENTFAIAEAERSLVQRFIDKFGIHGVERVDGDRYDPSNLASLLQGASLFAAKRLVVLKEAATNKPLWDALADWTDKVPDDTTVVVIEPTPDKRSRTYKTLKSKTEFKEFAQATDSELASWARTRAKEIGASLSDIDIRYLIERVGRDQWRLSNELNKLADYNPAVDRAAIDTLVEASPEGNAFELLDAALNGRSQDVTKLVANLRTEEDPYKLFGLLASQVHTLATVSAAGTRSADQIAKEAGLHPFVVRKTQSIARRLGVGNIKQIADDVALCDAQLKSTGADPWQLIAMCLQKIAAL